MDAGAYKKLLDGKEMSFFQKSYFSTLKIRVLKPCIKEPDTCSVTPHKKKRKRRKRTKSLRASTLTTVADSTKSYVLNLSPVAPNNPIDRNPHVEEATSSLSWELVNNQALCSGPSDGTFLKLNYRRKEKIRRPQSVTPTTL